MTTLHHTPTTPQVRIFNTDMGGYFVAVESADGLRIVNDKLLPRDDARQLADQVKRQIALHVAAENAEDNRAGRAVQLLASGAVLRNGSGYYVHSQTEQGRIYHTTAQHCTCPDHTYRRNTCKHILAVRMHQRQAAEQEFDELLQEARQQPPILSDADLEAMDNARIGFEESTRPYLY